MRAASVTVSRQRLWLTVGHDCSADAGIPQPMADYAGSSCEKLRQISRRARRILGVASNSALWAPRGVLRATVCASSTLVLVTIVGRLPTVEQYLFNGKKQLRHHPDSVSLHQASCVRIYCSLLAAATTSVVLQALCRVLLWPSSVPRGAPGPERTRCTDDCGAALALPPSRWARQAVSPRCAVSAGPDSVSV